jgi:purine-binding chemotaxis protein CheW
MSEIAASKSVEILTFEVAGQRYGLRAADVREVVRAVNPVTLPKAPAVVEGVINIRGKITPVFDLRRRFRQTAKPLDHTDQFIVAWAGGRLVALHVDRATDVVQLDAADVEEAKVVVPGVEYVAWMAKLPDNLVLIHDLHTFLSRAESETLEEALSASVAEGEKP